MPRRELEASRVTKISLHLADGELALRRFSVRATRRGAHFSWTVHQGQKDSIPIDAERGSRLSGQCVRQANDRTLQ